MKIIQHRKIMVDKSYDLWFPKKNLPGAASAFPCDENGNVDESNMMPLALDTWNEIKARMDQIVSGKDDVYSRPEIKTFVNRNIQPAIGICSCGKKVWLDGCTNTCECGADYNSAGQKLASRSQWGEETGESLSEILSIR